MAIELSSSEKENTSPIISIVLALSVLIFLVSVSIFAFFYFVISKEQETNIAKIKNDIVNQKGSEDKYNENDLAVIGKEINDYKLLMQARTKNSVFFTAFQTWIHPLVYFTNFNLDSGSGSVTLSGVARDFPALIQQMAILKNQTQIEKYDVSNIVMSQTGGVSFSLSLVAKPEVLK